MNIQTAIWFIVVVILVVMLGLGAWFIWPGDQTPSESTVQDVPISGNFTQSVTVPSPSGTINPAQEYARVFAALSATSLTFTKVASATGNLGDVYALYTDEIAQYKQLFPTAGTAELSISSTDLNSDNVQEAVVLVDMPGYCGSGGCPLDIYQKRDSVWQLVFTTLAYDLVGVMSTRTGGYNNLVLSVYGEPGYMTRVVVYEWDGNTYQPADTAAIWNGATFDLLR